MQVGESENSTELCTELSMMWGPLPPARRFQKKNGYSCRLFGVFFEERGTSTEGPKFFSLERIFVCFVHTHRIHACMMNLYLYMYYKHQQSTE